MPIYVVGHKNPDTDAVASAIAYADLKRKEGIDAVPAVASDINKGTQLVLERFEVPVPEKIDFSTVPEASIILVDHNEVGQRADGIIKEHVIEVIDHHRFSDFSTAAPIYILVQPWGSTSSIVTQKYQELGHVPERHIAGLLLSAILTDTVMFKSPITTDKDREMAAWLNEIVDIDMEKHAEEVFRRKSDITGMSRHDIIKKDYKEYHFNSHITTAVAVFETFDADSLLAKKEDLKEELRKIKEAKKYDFMIFAVVDILSEKAHFISTDEETTKLLEHLFNGKEKEGLITVPGIISRKKQIIPPLEEYFAQKS